MKNPLGSAEIKNLEYHAERVLKEEDSSKKIEPTRKQRENLAAWFDEAGNYNPDVDAHNSAIWEAILLEIIGRNDKLVIETLKSMTSTDVEIIHRLDAEGGIVSQGQASRLVQLGVVERSEIFTRHNIRRYVTISGIIFISYAFMRSEFFRIYLDTIFNKDEALYNRIGIYMSDFLRLNLIFVGIVLLFDAFFKYDKNKGRVFFTILGLKVKSRVDRFMKDNCESSEDK